MHPPDFRIDQRLSDWPQCRLEVDCPECGRVAVLPIQLLIREHGDRSFRTLVPMLRCRRCNARPAPVFLLAGLHRTHCHGAPPDWAVEVAKAK